MIPVREEIEADRVEILPYSREAASPGEYHRRALGIPAQPTPCVSCGWPVHCHRTRRAIPAAEK